MLIWKKIIKVLDIFIKIWLYEHMNSDSYKREWFIVIFVNLYIS